LVLIGSLISLFTLCNAFPLNKGRQAFLDSGERALQVLVQRAAIFHIKFVVILP